jgi:hypothetical protein
MAPPQDGQFRRQDSDGSGPIRQGGRPSEGLARSADTVQRLRNEGKSCYSMVTITASTNLPCTESWVEISSQPSSSSLSSIGDEIVTTGLRVQSDPNVRRKRRIYPGGAARAGISERKTSTSSQDEYEESESEEDHVMTSSNEHIAAVARVLPIVQDQNNSGSDSDDDDENATALGRVTDEPAFTPQPNAFSHPPSTQNSQRQAVPGSYFPRHPLPQSQERQSYASRSGSRAQHTPYNTISAAHQVDHDAALRASLTTLLSCAAAARGLPKRNQNTVPSASTSARPEFTGLRLVPESELMGTPPMTSRPLSPSTRPRSSPSMSDQDVAGEKGKRKALTSKPSAQPRATKKKKIASVDEAMISPTLLTWVVSAGVVVLVSVVGFGAGYAIGKEVGRQETLSGLSDNTSCGKEALKQVSEIRRFRWGNGRGIVA